MVALLHPGLPAKWHAHNVEQVIGGICAIWTASRSLHHIYRHLVYNRTIFRDCTVRILALVPLFALDAWACLMLETSVHGWTDLLTFVREIYEAVAMCSFMQLILTYLGGPKALAHKLLTMSSSTGVRRVHHPWPLRLVLRPYMVGPDFVANVVSGILQYVFVTLVLFVVNLFIWRHPMDSDVLHMRSYLRAAPCICKAASCGWAMYNVALMYLNTKKLIEPMRPFLKFLSFKGVIFFTFWQGFVISIFAHFNMIPRNPVDPEKRIWSQAQIASGIKNLLLCLEMVVFCEMHRWAYPVNEELEDVAGEAHEHLASERERKPKVVANILKASNLLDILVLCSEVSVLREESRAQCDDANVASAQARLESGCHSPSGTSQNRTEASERRRLASSSSSVPRSGWPPQPISC